MTPTSGNPPSGGEEGPKPQTRNPAGAAQQTPYRLASTTVALSQEAVCVATTGRIRRPANGLVILPPQLGKLHLWNGLRCVLQRTNMASTDIYGESDLCIYRAMSKRTQGLPACGVWRQLLMPLKG